MLWTMIVLGISRNQETSTRKCYSDEYGGSSLSAARLAWWFHALHLTAVAAGSLK